jgi:putative glutamine amidotransferase
MSGSEARPRPLVGICAAWDRAAWSFWEQDAALVAGTYLDAVRRAGGLPVALAPEELSAADVEALCARIDALLLIGGADLDPASFGAAPTERTELTTPLRDAFELALARAALDRDLPVLGICRGLQILNAATGGTLHHHLLDSEFAEHRPLPGSLGEETYHLVEVEPGSLLAEVDESGSLTVNSHHHQGVDRVGAGGRVVASSLPDGAVEAVEWPRCRFALGVQWHPEALELDTTIAGLVTAARAAVPYGRVASIRNSQTMEEAI